jgi:hypothetical protein
MQTLMVAIAQQEETEMAVEQPSKVVKETETLISEENTAFGQFERTRLRRRGRQADMKVPNK